MEQFHSGSRVKVGLLPTPRTRVPTIIDFVFLMLSSLVSFYHCCSALLTSFGSQSVDKFLTYHYGQSILIPFALEVAFLAVGYSGF